MSRESREYGRRAAIGLAVPQSNPVVEAEFAAMLPSGTQSLVARLQGSRSDSRSRLTDYFRTLDRTLETFDIVEVDVLAYACTASSYLIPREEEAKELATLEARFGYQILTATEAIMRALDHLGIKRIALYAPYPDWLAVPSRDYWQARGIEVAAFVSAPIDPSDTRSVYGMRSVELLEGLAKFDWNGADALLMTGTGMPTLRAISEVAAETDRPVLSSNLCLAWASLRAADVALPPPTSSEPLFSGWNAYLGTASDPR